MNKINRWFITIILTILSISSVYALQASNINDQYGYLDSMQIQMLQETIEKEFHSQNIDVVIVITEDIEGKNIEDFAADYYDNNNYGLDEKRSGLIFVIDMGGRQTYISTKGNAINIFTDNRLDDMLAKITKELSVGEITKACTIFLEEASAYIQYENLSFGGRVLEAIKNPFVYLIPLLITAIVVAGIAFADKQAFGGRYAEYEKDGSFKIHESREKFMHTTTTKSKIEKSTSNGSGGGSSTRKTSSGSTHGGKGAKF